ncbi:MAG: hypothetical protein JO233_03530 [Candidatus Eremiobacteraeota bacterium]|nr:hypothetical protein [Candidatus Eremiobacteraeota bacterium]
MKRAMFCVAAITLMFVVIVTTTNSSTRGPRMWHGCQIGIPERDFYDTDITNAPVERNSRVRIASVVAAMNAQDRLRAPNSVLPSQGFGDDRGLYPINIATSATPYVTVLPSVSWHRRVPSPAPYSGAFYIERGTDAHYFVVQAKTAPACQDFEYYQAAPVARAETPQLTAYAGQVLNTKTLDRVAHDGSPTVVGVNYLPSAITAEELDSASAGVPIRHVLNYVSQSYDMCACFVYPAVPAVVDEYNKGAARNTYALSPHDRQLPQGARLRLHAGYTDRTASVACRVVLDALKHYGMFFRDNGSAYDDSNVINTLNYPNSTRSSSADLRCLHNLRFTDFDVVKFAGPIEAPPS